MSNRTVLTGAIHVHTTDSDGTATHAEVAAIAEREGLDFLVFSDHMTLAGRDDGKERFYGRTLAIIGYEHNDPADQHHYLLIDTPQVYDPRLSAREYVAAGARDGAIGIIAHPDEIRNRLRDFPPYPWVDWNAEGYTGIELWNQMSEWMEKLTASTKLTMALWPRRMWVSPTDRILRQWDERNLTQKTVGVVGVDAHGFTRKLGPFEIKLFSYELHFRTLRNHLILPEPLAADYREARAQLLAALRDARLFCSNHLLGDASSARMGISGSGGVAESGGACLLDAHSEVTVELPERAEIRLIRNGERVTAERGKSMRTRITQPGVYRIECRRKERMWVFSNHIRVTTE